MKDFFKNLYLIGLQRKLRNLENQKNISLENFEEFKMKATTAKKNVKADYAFLAFSYKKSAQNYSSYIKNISEKIAKLKA